MWVRIPPGAPRSYSLIRPVTSTNSCRKRSLAVRRCPAIPGDRRLAVPNTCPDSTHPRGRIIDGDLIFVGSARPCRCPACTPTDAPGTPPRPEPLSRRILRELGRSHCWGGDQQYTVVAAVAVACCSSRSTVDDRSDQHITVVATAMVCCSPWPSPSVTTGSCRGGMQRCSIFAEQRWVPSRPPRDGGDAPLLRRGTLSAVTHPVDRSRRPRRRAPTRPPRRDLGSGRRTNKAGDERTV